MTQAERQTASGSARIQRLLRGLPVLVWRLLGLLTGVLFSSLALLAASLLILRFWWWRRFVAKPGWMERSAVIEGEFSVVETASDTRERSE